MFPISLDILIMAMIAGTILYKLYSILGTKDEDLNEDIKNKTSGINQIIDLTNSAKVFVKDISETKILETDTIPGFEDVLSKIRILDPKFSIQKFIDNSKVAFEMILTAFAENDKETLSNLLDKTTYNKFLDQINQRIGNNVTLQLNIVTLPEVCIKDISLTGGEAKIKVAIKSQQITVLRDKNSNIIQGNPSHIDYVEDVWKFKRDLVTSKNWLLIDVNNLEN